MTIIYSFLFCGFVCLLGQIILDNTNLTPGHITSLFVVIGSALGCFDIYPKIIKVVGIGANLPITSFGNTLANTTYEAFLKEGFLGLFTGILQGVSLGITAAVLFSFIFTIIFKSKN